MRSTGLRVGIPVAVGAFDAHLGAVGCGITPGTLVKIIGTSTCDIAIAPDSRALPDVPGLCGIVDGSVVPGFFGLEAGQSAVGDIFNWFVNCMQMRPTRTDLHIELSKAAARLKPGESGLLALDWNNGNRTVLVDQRLTGLLIGQTLYTRPEEIYRALIINRIEEFDVPINNIVNCGGIAEKNPLVMQIYADVTGRAMKVSRSPQTCALGAAIAGAVVAGKHSDFPAAMQAMSGLKRGVFKPRADAHAAYRELFALYGTLHDAFGTSQWNGNLHPVMKKLIEIRDRARNC
jgi:L-ribulokinase